MLRFVLGLLLGLLFLFYLAAIWFDWWPGLRGWGNYPQGWTWPTYPLPPWERFVPVIIIIAAIWSVISLTEISQRTLLPMGSQGNRTIKATFLVGMIALGFAFQMSLLGLKAENPSALLFQRVTNRVFTGYFTLAASAPGIDTFFSKYPDVFETKTCPHCSSHPPGPALFYWLNIRAAQALPTDWQANIAYRTRQILGTDSQTQQALAPLSDAQIIGAMTGGTLVLLLAALIVLPLYGLARILGPPGQEFRLAALGLALPGLMLMSPQFDQVLATLAAVAIYVAVRGLLAGDAFGNTMWGLTCGVVLAAGFFLSWSAAVILGAILVISLACLLFSRRVLVSRQLDEPDISLSRWGWWLVGLLDGVAVPLLLVYTVGHTDLLYIFNFNLNNEVTAEAQRPYSIWVFQGPIDFLQFLGLPLALTSLVALVVRSWAHMLPPRRLGEDALEGVRRAFRAPWFSRLNIYALLLWGLVLAIDLAGKSKAEQGRLLLFLMPLALAATFLWLGRSRAAPRTVTVLVLAQMAICVTIGARWFVP